MGKIGLVSAIFITWIAAGAGCVDDLGSRPAPPATGPTHNGQVAGGATDAALPDSAVSDAAVDRAVTDAVTDAAGDGTTDSLPAHACDFDMDCSFADLRCCH